MREPLHSAADGRDQLRSTAPTAIQTLDASQIDPAAELLSHAFEHDPLMTWAIPDEEARPAAERWLYARNIEYGLQMGVVEGTSDLQGVAIWLRPDATEMTFGALARAGMLASPLKLGLTAVRRLHEFTRQKEMLRHGVVGAGHWYLLLIAVDRRVQGSGVGGRLLEHGLARADRDGLPTYLETVREQSVRFFEKHDFQVVEWSHVRRGGPPLWAMLRRPRERRVA